MKKKCKKIILVLGKFLTNPRIRFSYLTKIGVTKIMSDELYLKVKYRLIFNRKLNLKNPQSFNEKLQWLKIHDRKNEYICMVDKYEVKKYVAAMIGEEYIVPTLGVWKKFEEIDFSKLPRQFALKCTHDSGGSVICYDKEKFDFNEAKRKFKKWQKNNYYWSGREWPYKNIEPRIIAEKYISDISKSEDEVGGLTDYKFFCFSGEPKFLYVSKGLENHSTAKISFLNMDWSFAPYKRSDYQSLDVLPDKPAGFEVMVEICRILSKGIPFVRVDLYQSNEKVYFSELTFFPCSGFVPFEKTIDDKEIGTMLHLPL